MFEVFWDLSHVWKIYICSCFTGNRGGTIYGVWLRWMQLMCVLPEQKGVCDGICPQWVWGLCSPHSLMPSPNWGLFVLVIPKKNGMNSSPWCLHRAPLHSPPWSLLTVGACGETLPVPSIAEKIHSRGVCAMYCCPSQDSHCAKRQDMILQHMELSLCSGSRVWFWVIGS